MKANAELYAASRTAIPELIAALEEERAENARLTALMPNVCATCQSLKFAEEWHCLEDGDEKSLDDTCECWQLKEGK